ncbi:hypothetical protein R0381_002568 [Jeongeupia wiesaeckerbachi]
MAGDLVVAGGIAPSEVWTMRWSEFGFWHGQVLRLKGAAAS